jgi:diadenylate cyclase
MDVLVDFFRPFLRWEYLLEILLIWSIIYAFLRFTEGGRGAGVLKGVALFLLFVLLAVSILARWGNLEQVRVILHFAGGAAITALIVIFQPELRRALVKIGQSPIFGAFLHGQVDVVDEVVSSVGRMAKNKIGALLAFEREVELDSYVDRGVVIDAEVSSQLLVTIFYPGTELHDGAVVIQGGRIAAAGCLFPFSENPDLGPQLGTRHRAGLGLVEETDAICVVVSEENGAISLAADGVLERNLDQRQLDQRLRELYVQERQEERKARVA